MSSPTEFDAIHSVLQLYFDGLYHSDTTRLAQVFHPDALYATAVGDKPIVWRMDEYFPVVDARPAPAASRLPRTDRVLSIELIGPVTARTSTRVPSGTISPPALRTWSRPTSSGRDRNGDSAWALTCQVRPN